MKVRLSTSRELPKVASAPNVTRNNVNDMTNQADPVRDVPTTGIGDVDRLTGKTRGEDNTDFRAEPKPSAITLRQTSDGEEQTGRDAARKVANLGNKGENLRDTQVFTYSNSSDWKPKTEFERLFAPLGERLAAILRGEGPQRVVQRTAEGEPLPSTELAEQERAGVPATTLMASESRGKSPSAKARSQMLKLIMPELSREQGDQLAQAIKNHDGETVQRILTSIGHKLNKVVSRKK